MKTLIVHERSGLTRIVEHAQDSELPLAFFLEEGGELYTLVRVRRKGAYYKPLMLPSSMGAFNDFHPSQS